ncbi:MAG: hypothetical protein R3B54_02960 [Bdellovibrionota bacterium]
MVACKTTTQSAILRRVGLLSKVQMTLLGLLCLAAGASATEANHFFVRLCYDFVAEQQGEYFYLPASFERLKEKIIDHRGLYEQIKTHADAMENLETDEELVSGPFTWLKRLLIRRTIRKLENQMEGLESRAYQLEEEIIAFQWGVDLIVHSLLLKEIPELLSELPQDLLSSARVVVKRLKGQASDALETVRILDGKIKSALPYPQWKDPKEVAKLLDGTLERDYGKLAMLLMDCDESAEGVVEAFSDVREPLLQVFGLYLRYQTRALLRDAIYPNRLMEAGAERLDKIIDLM